MSGQLFQIRAIIGLASGELSVVLALTRVSCRVHRAENELEQKISENEFRRRQWLMNWHIEVVEMQNELYDMEQSLERSLVRTESAKARDKAAKKEAAAPQMSE